MRRPEPLPTRSRGRTAAFGEMRTGRRAVHCKDARAPGHKRFARTVSTRYVRVIYAHRCKVFLRERCPGKRHSNYCRRRTCRTGRAKPRVEELRKSWGKERVPPDVKEGDLSEWGTARVFRRILIPEILATPLESNGGLADDSKIEYQPLFYFCYRDGDRMITTGGLLYETGQRPIAAGCGLYRDRLDFLRLTLGANTKPCMIEGPKLAYKEIRHLDRQLPRAKRRKLTVPKVPPADIKRYENIYRYFPAFAETGIAFCSRSAQPVYSWNTPTMSLLATKLEPKN